MVYPLRTTTNLQPEAVYQHRNQTHLFLFLWTAGGRHARVVPVDGSNFVLHFPGHALGVDVIPRVLHAHLLRDDGVDAVLEDHVVLPEELDVVHRSYHPALVHLAAKGRTTAL